MTLIVPYFAQAQTAAIVIEGVTYRVPLIDSGGRVYVNAKATGAGEVLAARLVTVDPSTTRATVATPTSGKAIRIISMWLLSGSATGARFEVYFGTGAGISTTAGKEIAEAAMVATLTQNWYQSWPDGGGPVGAVDDVVSLRTSANIFSAGSIIIHYREE